MAQNRPFQAYGLGQPLKNFPPDIQFQVRDPNAFDFYPEGTQWINTASNAIFFLTSFVAGAPVWTSVAGGAGFFTSLTVAPGNITVSNGNINVAEGTITADGNITTETGNLVAEAGNVFAAAGTFQAAHSTISMTSMSADATPSALDFIKNRAGGPVVSGDFLLLMDALGYDSASAPQVSANIYVQTTGTIGAARVPSNMVFQTTPDGVAPALTEVMRLTSEGNVQIAAPTAGAPLILPGPINVYTGAGAPGAGLAVNVGDLYVNTTAATAATRLYIATGAGTWTNVTCAA